MRRAHEGYVRESRRCIKFDERSDSGQQMRNDKDKGQAPAWGVAAVLKVGTPCERLLSCRVPDGEPLSSVVPAEPWHCRLPGHRSPSLRVRSHQQKSRDTRLGA